MTPILYGANATTFTSNGIGRLSDAISCVVTEERNGMYELTMQYPITGLHYEDIQISRIIRAIPFDGGTLQGFRIYEITKPISGIVTVYARHLTYQLSNIPVTPFSASSVVQALAGLKSHAAESCPFDFWTDKTTAANFSVDVPCSIRSRLGGVQGSILDCYGGEYEFDNYTVKLHAARGSNNGVTIRYGKNLKTAVQDENIESCITGILPYWYASTTETVMTLPELIVQSEYAENFPYNRTVAVDFSDRWQDQPTTAQLRAAAVAYVEANAVGVPKVNVTVDFVPLWQTENYKDIAPLERVHLCDTVTVHYDALGIDATAKVVRTEYDVLLDRYSLIEIGDARSSITDQIAGTGNEIDTRVAESVSMLRKAITNSSEMITGNLGGYIVTRYDANGYPYELLIMDTPDIDTATKVWRWNASGLGYSSTGYNGTYGLAITANGAIVADFITTGTLDANLIRAGVLQDAAQRNYWNLTTGEFSLQGYASSSTAIVQTVVEYATGNSSSTAPTSGWSTNTPTWTDGTYIWQRVMSVYGDNHTTYSNPVCIQGAKGADGTSVTIMGYYDSLDQLYYDHPTGSVGDAYMVDGDLYVWVTGATGYLQFASGEVAYNTADLLEVYRGSGWVYTGQIRGDQGEQGETGLGYSSITPQYYLSTSNTTQTGGSWSTTQPTWVPGKYLWSRSYIVWTDGSTSTTSPYLEGAINSANETAYQADQTATAASNAVTALDNSLDMQGVFNRLTQNGTVNGIFLQNDQLYINGSYIATGIITDATGDNWWNLTTGEFHNGTYVSSSDMATYVAGVADDTLDAAMAYTDQMREGSVTYYQPTIPSNPEIGDVWYIDGDSELYDYYIDSDLEISNDTLEVDPADIVEIAYTLYHQRMYWWDGSRWLEIKNSTFDSYPTTETVTSSIDSAVGQLSATFTHTLTGYTTNDALANTLAGYPTTDEMNTAISASAEGVTIEVNRTLAGYSTTTESQAYADSAANSALSDSQDYTDNALVAYPTTTEMNTAINASAAGISANITQTLTNYATISTAESLSTEAYNLAKQYADGIDVGNHEFFQETVPATARDKDTWYVGGDDDIGIDANLEFSQGELVYNSDDPMQITYYCIAGRYYSYDGANGIWVPMPDSTFVLYPTIVEYQAGLEATAQQLTSNYQEFVDGKLQSYSTITQTAEAINTTVSNYYNKTEIDQKAGSLTLSASMSGKTATITLSGDGVTTQAQNLNFQGYATFTDLSGTMSTAINGANIETGTISATKISLGDFTNYATVNNKDATSAVEANYYGGSTVSDNYIVKQTPTTTYMLVSPFRACNFAPDNEFYFEMTAKAATAGTFYLRWVGSTTNPATASTINRDIGTSFSLTTSDQKITGSIKLTNGSDSTAYISASKYYAFVISGSGQVYVKNLVINRKAQGNLIVDGSITTTKLAADSVTSAKIAAGAVTATELSSGSVTTAKLAAGAVTATQIASGAITTDKLAADSVTAAKLAANSVTASELAANSVTAAKIASQAVTTAKLLLTGMMTVYQSASNTTAYGYLGYGSGNDGSSTTYGVKLAASGGNYVIVTNSGARMTAGTSIYVVSTGCYVTGTLRAQSTSIFSGAATFNSSISVGSGMTVSGNASIGGTISFGTATSFDIRPKSTNYYSLGTSSLKYYNVYASNKMYASSFETSSDRRAKAYIRYDVDKKYHDLFMALKPASFRYRGQKPRMLGLIAQDVEESLAELGIAETDFGPLNKEDPKLYTINYSGFVGLLISEVQRLRTELDELKEKV